MTWRGYFRPQARPVPVATTVDPCAAFGHREVWNPGDDTTACGRCGAGLSSRDTSSSRAHADCGYIGPAEAAESDLP